MTKRVSVSIVISAVVAIGYGCGVNRGRTETPGASPPALVQGTAVLTPGPAAAYCLRTGTTDEPTVDSNPAVPWDVQQAAIRKFGRDIALSNSVSWRCSGSSTLWCLAWGTNYCGKADLTATPNQALIDYCRQASDTDDVGRVVTGRAAANQWGCKAHVPFLVAQRFAVDEQGYFRDVWFPLEN